MDASLAHLISWSEPTKGNVPPPLTGPSITISPLSSTVFLFGGKYVHNRKLTNEMWAMDIGTRIWSRVDAGAGPGPRYFHSMDVWEDKLVCFGGMSDTEPMSVHNDIWFFDCNTRRWLPRETAQDPSLVPLPRYAHLSAVSRGKLVISGGQHSDNSWIYQVNVYDLKRRQWVSKTEQPEVQGLHSKGAYRSVACSSKQRVIQSGDKSIATYSIDEEGEGGDIWCYSNYDFAKVRRELDLITPSDTTTESHKHLPPPDFDIQDRSSSMHGSSQPPGLRFPTGGIVGNHFILCGLYLASSSAAFSIYSLDLSTMQWRHLEPAVLNTGSWNRAVLWPETARLLVFGNSEFDLASDYGRRAVNLDNVAIISLETYGIYRPPRLEIPAKVQDVGLKMLDEKLASDFEVICDDGRRIKCSRQLLTERWPWFAQEEQSLIQKLSGAVQDPPLDIADTLLGSFTPARLASSSLTIPEPFPVCVALVQYFYTLSLSTPLQNRAPILSALLFLAKQYKIDRLGKLVVHTLHERLEPALAVGIYEIATLAGEQALQIRALNMIHSGKGGSSSKSHKQGPPGSVTDDGRSTPGTNGTQPSSAAQASAPTGNVPPLPDIPEGHRDTDTHRRARAESFTLVDNVDEQVGALLDALQINANEAVNTPAPNISRGPSPTLGIMDLPTRSASRRAPIGPPPNAYRAQRQPDFTSDWHHSAPQQLPSSPTNSESTAPYPQTPSESIRESFILPRDSYPSDHSSASSGHGHLPDVPEDGRLRQFRQGSNGSLNQSPDKRLHQRTLENAGMFASSQRGPPTAMSSYRAQAIYAGVNQESLTRGHTANRHLSVQTASSTSSTSSRQDVKLIVPSSPETDFSFVLEEKPGRSQVHPRMPMQSTTTLPSQTSTYATSSIDLTDNSSMNSGNSGKKAAKMEKKAIQAAEKAAKKAEAQAKFEALRSEQMKRMAEARVAAQLKAESVQYEKPAPIPVKESKSKFGKFGAKFTETVLFPSSGSSSSMF